ncbi:MAG: hypothetical protein ACJ763_19650 [Bdellovibrionia bacterium]
MIRMTFRILCLIAGFALNAHAEHRVVHCTFGTCKAEITSNDMLEISCEDRAMYTGTYTISTEYRTTRILSSTADGPRIIAQGLPSENSSTQAALILSGQEIRGSCRASQVEPTRD